MCAQGPISPQTIPHVIPQPTPTTPQDYQPQTLQTPNVNQPQFLTPNLQQQQPHLMQVRQQTPEPQRVPRKHTKKDKKKKEHEEKSSIAEKAGVLALGGAFAATLAYVMRRK